MTEPAKSQPEKPGRESQPAEPGPDEPQPAEPGPRTSARELLAAERAATTRRLTALEREFGSIVESAGQAGTDDEHDPEGATIAFERQHVAALIGQAREQLAGIEAAWRRLDEGRYGQCERCGLPIGAERLAARPAASMCVSCAKRR